MPLPVMPITNRPELAPTDWYRQNPVLVLVLCLWLVLCSNAGWAAGSSSFEHAIELYKQKKYEEAAQRFGEAATVDAKNPSVYYYQANCQYALGHRWDAIQFYQ